MRSVSCSNSTSTGNLQKKKTKKTKKKKKKKKTKKTKKGQGENGNFTVCRYVSSMLCLL
jgi:hypothetical protein